MLVFNSCKSTKKKNSETSQWNYTAFREQQQSFNSEDGTLKYIDQGEGKVILLLHGIPTSSWLYRKMIPELTQKGYRVIAPDMLGFGSSDNPKGYDIYTPREHAKRIVALMDSLHIKTWSHVTHDAGGLWTWELIKSAPKRVDNIILLNTIIYEEGFNPPIKMKRGGFAQFSMWLYKNKSTANILVDQLFKKGLKENNLSLAEIEGYKKPLKEGKTRAMYQFFSNTCNTFPDYSNVLKNCIIPTMVIWGAHDTMLQWSPQADQVTKDLKIAAHNIHLIDAKHFIQEEKPELINSYIVGFLRKNTTYEN
tara:strand:- start:11844 stop:12767 length:924 start_codon:yes stop_codon:yes gene_type:complete